MFNLIFYLNCIIKEMVKNQQKNNNFFFNLAAYIKWLKMNLIINIYKIKIINEKNK